MWEPFVHTMYLCRVLAMVIWNVDTLEWLSNTSYMYISNTGILCLVVHLRGAFSLSFTPRAVWISTELTAQFLLPFTGAVFTRSPLPLCLASSCWIRYRSAGLIPNRRGWSTNSWTVSEKIPLRKHLNPHLSTWCNRFISQFDPRHTD